MSDSRAFTDYRPNAVLFSRPVSESSHDARQHEIVVGESSMAATWSRLHNKYGWKDCATPFFTGTMLPEKNMVECTATACKTVSNNILGLGTGRAYGPATVNDPLQSTFINQNAGRVSRDDDHAEDRLATAYGNVPFAGTRLAIPSGGKIR